MSSPLSPRMLKGALVSVDPRNPVAGVIVFQYNPDTLSRRIEARSAASSAEPDRREALRLIGPPRETISMSIEMDAADLPGGAIQAAAGIYPPMAALEMLLYPKTRAVLANQALAAAGMLEIIPPPAPLVLLIWGPGRIVPVRMTGLSLTEEQHDALLTPTRGKADLSLEVLSYYDLPRGSAGHTLFMVHQVTKEVLASLNLASSAASAAVGMKLL